MCVVMKEPSKVEGFQDVAEGEADRVALRISAPLANATRADRVRGRGYNLYNARKISAIEQEIRQYVLPLDTSSRDITTFDS